MVLSLRLWSSQRVVGVFMACNADSSLTGNGRKWPVTQPYIPSSSAVLMWWRKFLTFNRAIGDYFASFNEFYFFFSSRLLETGSNQSGLVYTGSNGSYCFIPVHTGFDRFLLVLTGSHQYILVWSGSYCFLLVRTSSDWFILVLTGVCMILLNSGVLYQSSVHVFNTIQSSVYRASEVVG